MLQDRDVGSAVADERRQEDVIVRVAAGSIVVEADGPNYAPAVQRETKKANRQRICAVHWLLVPLWRQHALDLNALLLKWWRQ